MILLSVALLMGVPPVAIASYEQLACFDSVCIYRSVYTYGGGNCEPGTNSYDDRTYAIERQKPSGRDSVWLHTYCHETPDYHRSNIIVQIFLVEGRDYDQFRIEWVSTSHADGTSSCELFVSTTSFSSVPDGRRDVGCPAGTPPPDIGPKLAMLL